MTDMSSRPPLVLNGIYYAVPIAFFVYILHYYWTGSGGSTLLALTLIPITFVLFVLQSLRGNEFYPKLPPMANYVIAAIYIAISLYVSYYMTVEYEEIGTSRAGMWDTADLVWGGLMTLLIMEYARKRHMPLFILNIALIIGSATIPSMIGAGMPPATAAAIESASSLGGQLMPPVMGISAFLMAEFLGKDYFDVVARGWVPALIYYATVSTSVYLLAIRFRTRLVVGSVEGLTWRDLVNLGAFVVVVTGLVGLMATVHLAPMFAALYVFIAVGSALFVINFVSVLSQWSPRGLIEPIVRFLDAFTDMISDLP